MAIQYRELKIKDIKNERDIEKFLNNARGTTNNVYVLIEDELSDNPCMYTLQEQVSEFNLNYSICLKNTGDARNPDWVCWWKSKKGVEYLSIADMAKSIWDVIQRDY